MKKSLALLALSPLFARDLLDLANFDEEYEASPLQQKVGLDIISDDNYRLRGDAATILRAYYTAELTDRQPTTTNKLQFRFGTMNSDDDSEMNTFLQYFYLNRLDAKSNLSFDFRFRDQISDDIATNNQGDIAYQDINASVKYGYGLTKRLGVNVRPFFSRRDFDEGSRNDSTTYGAGVTLRRKLTPTSSATLAANFSDTDYDNRSSFDRNSSRLTVGFEKRASFTDAFNFSVGLQNTSYDATTDDKQNLYLSLGWNKKLSPLASINTFIVHSQDQEVFATNKNESLKLGFEYTKFVSPHKSQLALGATYVHFDTEGILSGVEDSNDVFRSHVRYTHVITQDLNLKATLNYLSNAELDQSRTNIGLGAYLSF